MKLERLILSNLLKNETYLRKVIPYLKSEYLSESPERNLLEEIKQFVSKYNQAPTKSALEVSLKNKSNLTESEFSECNSILKEISSDSTEQKLQWLLDETEKFCQEKAIYNAIMDSIHILDGKDDKRGKGNIPTLLSDALAVSFDPNVGHDYVDDYSNRYDFYHRIEKRIPFDLEYFNKITKGGLPQKTLNIALAGTGVGKSLFMCHVAASCLMQNYNVLYITLEMSEERIAERIDANLLNVTIDDLMNLPKDMYEKRMQKLQNTVKGKLIIKEYPTASANPAHFRGLLNELSLKKNFKPDIIFVDYLNICASSRIKAGSNVNSYTYIKAIAEELRGLAVEFNVPIVSATQTTRSGFSSSDPGLEDTSESFGLPATADFMFALISTEELQQLNQIMVKQLKNRYNDPTSNKRFTVGIDKAKMKLYDIESSQQDYIADSGQQVEIKPKDNKSKFGGWKV
jgi:archaellum biogenesis ATPase FlaH